MRQSGADSVWVLDLATARRVAALAPSGDWTSLIAGEGTLLALDGKDVNVISLATTPPRRSACSRAAARSLWLAIPWVPN